jgi:hypothetical protein
MTKCPADKGLSMESRRGKPREKCGKEEAGRKGGLFGSAAGVVLM